MNLKNSANTISEKSIDELRVNYNPSRHKSDNWPTAGQNIKIVHPYLEYLKKSSTDGDFVRIVYEGTCSGLFLGAFAEFVIEHTVLLAPGCVLHDRVDTSVLGLGDALPSQRVSRPKVRTSIISKTNKYIPALTLESTETFYFQII